MAESEQAVCLMTQRHLIEQLAYEEIRRFLSQQFLLDPVLFMNTHGKRPEDLDGEYLRSYYKEALSQGLQVQQSSPALFKQKFQSGMMFKAEHEQIVARAH